MDIIGFNGKPYFKAYDCETGKGWLGVESALCGVISVQDTEIFTRIMSPSTGDKALVYMASKDAGLMGKALVCARQNGEFVNYFSVPLVDFIRGDYKLPEKGE